MKGLDTQAMLAHAKKMREDMTRLDADLAQRYVEGKAGGGLVTAVFSCSRKISAIRIKPEAVDKDDLEILEDLILLAVKDGLEKANATYEAEMSKITGGINLPGMF